MLAVRLSKHMEGARDAPWKREKPSGSSPARGCRAVRWLLHVVTTSPAARAGFRTSHVLVPLLGPRLRSSGYVLRLNTGLAMPVDRSAGRAEPDSASLPQAPDQSRAVRRS